VRAAGRPLRVLNAFAYTGAATLAAAGAGEVATVHLDGARGAVTWARRNAALCGLESRPIRWIVDDVMTFLRREKKRGSRYDGFLLDPPAFGRGAGGRTWELDRDLPGLLGLTRELLSDIPAFVLLTCHDPALTPEGLAAQVRAAGYAGPGNPEAGTLVLHPEGAGRALPGSLFVRWALT
jgi:23S rRNA (cytosine1962-C5)-methyltransferase